MIACLFGATAFVAFLAYGDDATDRIVPPAAETIPEPTAIILTAQEREFYDYVSPRLRAIAAESFVLAELGQQRSRNLIELQVRSDRVSATSAEIDTFVTNVTVPARFAQAMAEYDAGVTAIRTGMDEAKAAFFSFNWDALGPALDQFTLGSMRVDASVRSMDAAAGMATPVASPVNT